MKKLSIILCLGVLPAFLISGCSKQETATEETKAKPSAASQEAPAPVNPAFTGTISGEIIFDGAVPKAQLIDMTQDPACVMGTQPNLSQAYAVKNRKLENVYVYVKAGLAESNYGVPKEPVVLDQRGCRYVPHVAGAMAGQKIRILNSDPTMHNVHPNAQVNSPWNITQSPKGEPLERSFSTPELMIKVMCNQHPWMRMYLNVSAHPFFAVSDEDGHFEIKGLPPGEYTLAALHERMGEKTMKVKVEAQKTSEAEFGFGAGDVGK